MRGDDRAGWVTQSWPILASWVGMIVLGVLLNHGLSWPSWGGGVRTPIHIYNILIILRDISLGMAKLI